MHTKKITTMFTSDKQKWESHQRIFSIKEILGEAIKKNESAIKNDMALLAKAKGDDYPMGRIEKSEIDEAFQFMVDYYFRSNR